MTFDLIIQLMRLVLASASPRRAELLAAAGFTFDTLPVDIDESRRPGEPAADYVRRLAAEKTAVAFERAFGRVNQDAVFLGADTAVVVDDDILGKPRDDEDARNMLRRLSGRAHEVITGVSLRTAGGAIDGVETTIVWFAPLTADDISWYVSTKEGQDKAGAYAIQGVASRFIPRIQGSYPNVVGLPVSAINPLLRQLIRPGGSDTSLTRGQTGV